MNRARIRQESIIKGKVRKIGRLFLISVLTLSISSCGFSAFALTGDELSAAADEAERVNGEPAAAGNENADVPAAAKISTVVSGRDVLLEEGEASYGSEDRPAELTRYTEYKIIPEVAKKIEKQEAEAERIADEKGAKEALAFAKELVKSGKYKDFIGEDNKYISDYYDWYDDDYSAEDYSDDEDEDESVDDEYDADDDESADDQYDEADTSDEDDDSDWDDSDDEENDDEDEDVDDESDSDDSEDEEPDEYYLKLGSKFPNIDEFWFDPDGHYHYEHSVYPDYSDIDYESMYERIEHNTFAINDSLEYSGFEPNKKYTLAAELVRVEADRSEMPDPEIPAEELEYLPDEEKENSESEFDPADNAEDSRENTNYSVKETIKALKLELDTDESGEGKLTIDFGEMELEHGRYVVLAKVYDEDGNLYADHSDPNNSPESLEVFYPFFANEASLIKGAGRNAHGDGFLKFPDEGRRSSSPDTGDDAPLQILMYFFIITAAGSAIYTVRRARGTKG